MQYDIKNVNNPITHFTFINLISVIIIKKQNIIK